MSSPNFVHSQDAEWQNLAVSLAERLKEHRMVADKALWVALEEAFEEVMGRPLNHAEPFDVALAQTALSVPYEAE